MLTKHPRLLLGASTNYSESMFLPMSNNKIKRAARCTKLPLCAGFEERPYDIVRCLTLRLARTCFYSSNPWPPGHMVATFSQNGLLKSVIV